MKKLVLFGCLALLGLVVQAQNEFRAGAHIGLPIGDSSDFATFAIAVDLGYLFEITEEVQVGPTVGYSHSFGDTIDTGLGSFDIDDVQFIPIAASGHYNFTEEFWFGLDLGYALGLNDGNDGGFYYSPRFAYGVAENIDIALAWRGISVDGGSWDILSLGVEFAFD
ncbi:MAG: hypothetical protein ACR2MM_06405 [Flavobacteriaceae bacterium]